MAWVAFLGLLIVAGCTTATSTSTTTTSTTTTTHGGTTSIMVGSWSGYWYDTIFDVGGPMSATINQNSSSLEATGSINLSSIGYTFGVETGSAEGTVGTMGATATFSFSSAIVGNGAGTINGTDITGAGTVTGPFGTFTFSGTIDASGDVIRGEFDFTSGGLGTAEVHRL